jgi:hypothetical protein
MSNSISSAETGHVASSSARWLCRLLSSSLARVAGAGLPGFGPKVSGKDLPGEGEIASISTMRILVCDRIVGQFRRF